MYFAELTSTQRIDTWIPIGFFVMLWALMQWNRRLPSTDSIQKFVAIINSRGGNIIILSVASVYFFRYSMYLFLHLLHMVQDKTITEDNAFALMAIQFVTTSAFGGAVGALLKTMTGDSSTARATDHFTPRLSALLRAGDASLAVPPATSNGGDTLIP